MIISVYSIQALITSFFSLLIGVFVFSKNRKSLVNKTLALWTLSVSLWAFGISRHAVADNPLLGLAWSRILHGAAIWIPTFFLHFIRALLKIEKKKWIIWLSYICSGIFFIFNFTDLFIQGTRQVLNFEYFPIAGPVYSLFVLMFVLCVLYSLSQVHKAIKKSFGNKRNQMKYVFWGSVIGFAGGSTTFFPVFNVRIFPLGNLFIFLYISLVAYAIFKHHLMDIKIALTRAGIFAFVYLLVLGIPIGLTGWGKNWLQGLFGPSWYWAPVVLAIALATAGPFIYGYLRRRAENVLLAEQKRYQKALKEFSSNLIFIRKVDELCQKVLDKVMTSIKLDFAAIYLKENDSFNLKDKRSEGSLDLPKEIENNSKFTTSLADSTEPVLGEYLPALAEKLKVGLVCSLRLNGNLYGLLILGKKEENKIFTDTDIDAFSIVSAQTSLALSEIYYFQEYQKATHQKHKLEIEKARIESAFQIADAYRHELGNIINIISVSLMDLSSMGGYEPTKEDVERVRAAISRNVKRATQIFNAVKSYNENSNKEPEPQKLDNLLNYALEEEKETLSKENIKLGLDIARNIEVKANNNLGAALTYLVKGAMTAIDYIKPKEKLIQIKLTKNKDKALLEISDTGGDVTQDKNYRGVGIERGREGGILYFLARRIIFDQRGEFQFGSFGDKGTTFSIELPLI